MNTLFLLLFMICSGCLIAGLIKPEFLSKIFKRNLVRKQIGLIFGISTVAALLLFSVTAPAKQQEIKNETGLTVQTQQTQTKTAPVTVEKIGPRPKLFPSHPPLRMIQRLPRAKPRLSRSALTGQKR